MFYCLTAVKGLTTILMMAIAQTQNVDTELRCKAVNTKPGLLTRVVKAGVAGARKECAL